MRPQSIKSKAQEFRQNIMRLIRSVFNSEFFGIYEGVIKEIDSDNAILTVTIPDLDNLILPDCRIATPCVNSESKIIPRFEVDQHVMVGFRKFSLQYPVVFAQIEEFGSAINEESITLQNGDASIRLNSDGSVTINATSIILTGTTITANGEDLTVDDIGTI
jgi:hypothetical protein